MGLRASSSRALALAAIWASAAAAAFFWSTVAIAVVTSVVLAFVEVRLLVFLLDFEIIIVNTELVDVGAGRSMDTREAAVLEVESVSLADDGSVWTKEISLLGAEGDGGDFSLVSISAGHDELVDAVSDVVDGDLGNPFGTGGVSMLSTEFGGLVDHVLPVDSDGVEVWGVINLDEVNEPVGVDWLVIERCSSQVSIWTLLLDLVEVDLIIGDGECLGHGVGTIVVLHVSKGANGGNQCCESDSNACFHLIKISILNLLYLLIIFFILKQGKAIIIGFIISMESLFNL